MALPKILKTLDEKLDRVLAILDLPAALRLAQAGTPVSDLPAASAAQAGPLPQPKGIDPEQLAAWLDYESYAAHEIIARASSLPAEQRAALYEYELAHKARKSALEALSKVEEM